MLLLSDSEFGKVKTEFSIAHSHCPDGRVDLACTKELVSCPETHTSLEVPGRQCESALKAVNFYMHYLSKTSLSEQRDVKKQKSSQWGGMGFVCSGGGTEEAVKVRSH